MRTSSINLAVFVTLVGRENCVRQTPMTVRLSPALMAAAMTTWLVSNAVATPAMLEHSVKRISMSVSITAVNTEEPVKMGLTCTPVYAPRTTVALDASEYLPITFI